MAQSTDVDEMGDDTLQFDRKLENAHAVMVDELAVVHSHSPHPLVSCLVNTDAHCFVGKYFGIVHFKIINLLHFSFLLDCDEGISWMCILIYKCVPKN